MTERFNNAVTKLYTAFHEGTLDAMDCKHCCIGNLCGGDQWVTFQLSGFGKENRINTNFVNNTNYSRQELATIEALFIFGVKDPITETELFSNSIAKYQIENGQNTKEEQKELQFKGLCAVIEYLAELDNIPNPFNFDNLFNQDKEIASLELAVIEN